MLLPQPTLNHSSTSVCVKRRARWHDKEQITSHGRGCGCVQACVDWQRFHWGLGGECIICDMSIHYDGHSHKVFVTLISWLQPSCQLKILVCCGAPIFHSCQPRISREVTRGSDIGFKISRTNNKLMWRVGPTRVMVGSIMGHPYPLIVCRRWKIFKGYPRICVSILEATCKYPSSNHFVWRTYALENKSIT